MLAGAVGSTARARPLPLIEVAAARSPVAATRVTHRRLGVGCPPLLAPSPPYAGSVPRALASRITRS